MRRGIVGVTGVRAWRFGAQDKWVVDVDVDHLGFARAYEGIILFISTLSSVDFRRGGVDGATR